MDKIRQITIIILILFSVFCAEISEATALLPGLTLHKEKDNVVVLDVQRGSKAWEVGIKRGDILLKIDGQEIKILDDYVKKTKSTSRDETVTLIFLRHGEEYVIIKDSNNYHKKNKVIEQSETVGGSIVDYEIVETKFIGTQSNNRMMYKIVVNPTITREQVKPTAGKIIKAITSKDKDIDEITLFFYSDRSVIDEAYDIASVDWGYPENEGRIKFNINENFEQYIKQRSKSETLFELTEQTRREIFKELVSAEDRAFAETDRLIGPSGKKRRELQEKYKQKVREKYNITKEISKKIEMEGQKENWPFPPL